MTPTHHSTQMIYGATNSRQLARIHIGLVLLIPLLLSLLTGCRQTEAETFDLGSEANVEDVEAALQAPLANADPLKIKVGEFVHFSETQEIGGGKALAVVSDTGQTVISRQDQGDRVSFTVVEHKFTYQQDGNYTKVSREFTNSIMKLSESSASTSPPFDTSEAQVRAADPLQSPAMQSPEMQSPDMSASLPIRETSPLAILRSQSFAWAQGDAAKVFAAILSPQQTRTTYHRLRTWIEDTDPPERVRQRPNCAGVPNCRIRVHRIAFDQVNWIDGKPDVIGFEFAMSPDVPYLAGLLDKCATLLVPVGTNGSKVLVKQCSPVQDFRFEESAQ